MSPTITVRSLPGFAGVVLAAALLLAGADARRAAVEIVVERRAGALAWLVFRLALGPTLLFLTLRKLRARGDSDRSEVDDLWLTAMFGVGTVYYYASVIGQVWYTAHIVATVLTGLFVLSALDAAHPILAGLFLGAIVLTRPQMGFWGILFLYEMRRAKKPIFSTMLKVGVPVLAFGVVAAAFNFARFHFFC